MSEVVIGFVDGHAKAAVNGAIRRRIALKIDDTEEDVVSLRLDSDHARRQQAKRWSQQFNIDASVFDDKLRKTALIACKQAQEVGKPTERPRGAIAPPTPPHTLDDARPVFAKWLKDLDPDLLDVTLGTILAHHLDGDPVWTFIVGPPGDGKTEVLRSTSQHPTVYMLSSLKPASLISGFQNDNGPDPSLLPKLDGKVLMIKDFTTVLTMPADARSEILGTLRDAFDGEAARAFGTGETKRYKSRFGILAAVTPFIDKCWSTNQQLGERFLRLRLRSGGRKRKARSAISNANNEKIMRLALSEAALGVLAQEGQPVPILPADIESRLIDLADFVARARSEVSRNRQGVVEFMPVPEIPTRVAKQLKKLAQGIAMARNVREVDDDIYRILRRVALDTIPSVRRVLLDMLWGLRDDFQPTSTIADAAEIPTDTAGTWLADLRLLGISERFVAARNAHTWRLRADFVATIEGSRVFEGMCIPPGGDSAPHGRLTPGDCGVPNQTPPHTHHRAEPENPLFDTENGDSVGDGHGKLEPDNSDEAEREAIQEVETTEEEADAIPF